MEANLLTFREQLVDLKHYIQGIELEKQLLSTKANNDSLLKFQAHFAGFAAQKRRFDYNSIIVSFYGFFEQFIECMIRDYVKTLNTLIPKYKKLPAAIDKNHIDLSFKLIALVEQPRYKGHLTTTEIISNLNRCLNESNHYQINAEAFVYHTANFRAGVITESFARLGIDNISSRILNSTTLITYLQTEYPDLDLAITQQEEKAFYYLNDLTERRNEVAHGTLPDAGIPSNNIFLEYIKFFEVYSQALHEVLENEVLHYKVKYHGIELAQPKKVWAEGKVICISLKEITIKVGDLLIAKPVKKSLPYRAGAIKEIQVNRKKYDEWLASSEETIICMQVDYKAKDNQTFFLIPHQ